MQEIFDSQVRVIIMWTPYFDFYWEILDYIYDSGYRQGDFIFDISQGVLKVNSIRESDPELYSSRAELISYNFNMQQPFFLGEPGEHVKNAYLSQFNAEPHTFGCSNYDGLYTMAYALDQAIVQGSNY
jgi:hypothetical protein